MRGDEQSVTNLGKLFHTFGPATTKAQSSSEEEFAQIEIKIKDTAKCLRNLTCIR